MSCCTCNQNPCSCFSNTSCGECSETIQYDGQNINLAGVGVFEGLEDFLFSFRGVGSGDSYIDVELNDTTHVIEITLAVESLKLQQTFTDSAARMSATPQYLGQLATQQNNTTIWIGTSIAPGGWTQFT